MKPQPVLSRRVRWSLWWHELTTGHRVKRIHRGGKLIFINCEKCNRTFWWNRMW